MLLERIFDADLAHASYVIACQASGEAIVVDPRRDIAVYRELADRHGLTITAVTETHIHADYLSGTRELAAATGATMYVSDEGGPDWSYGAGFDDAVRLRDGDEIALGNITLRASHTPGHTPEHLSFLVTDGAQADAPGFMLTGDFVFVGDTGRPDLLDEAAGGSDTRFAGARDLFASLRDRLLTLPDYVQILPAHGAGSACGKALGAIPTTTVGYERAFAWWSPFLESGDEQGFVDELLSGQPDAHAYFARMKTENREGPSLLGELAELEEFDAGRVQERIEDGSAAFIDTRPTADVDVGTPAGALHIPGPGKAASFGAWVFDPAAESTPIIVLADDADQAAEFRNHLIRVGIDTVTGYVTSLAGMDLQPADLVDPADLADAADIRLVDVRSKNEHAGGHIPGATQLSGGRALWELDRLPSEGRIVTYCQSGTRSSITASALRRAGYQVAELAGSYDAWRSLES
ncbi:MBL fold metallo-hydrolase [Brevibacterium permense]|uniref:MBL fold metallo-hydrolase n=1 Tax=Brevibacterium permense TaxID=234834 RepID=A0ABN2AHH9_9MICO|nr:MBL fold metallo-hydrolase [Brevibacterium permense]